MGGKGKKSIKQLEKEQLKEQMKKEKKAKEVKETKKESKTTTAIVDTSLMGRVKAELKNFKYLSPWVISSQFSVKMGEAKRLLKRLESEGAVELIAHDDRNPIYKPKI
ncbi:MAG: hypothetical protein ACP5GU_00710 [Thermoprotei archaeon]|jgi:ribosomal protein S25